MVILIVADRSEIADRDLETMEKVDSREKVRSNELNEAYL
jgi:hypothetical protein